MHGLLLSYSYGKTKLSYYNEGDDITEFISGVVNGISHITKKKQ